MRSLYTQSKQIFHVFLWSFRLRNFFFTTMETLSQKSERKHTEKLHKYIYVYKHILIFFCCREMRGNICVTVVPSIAFIIKFYWYLSFPPRAKNAFSRRMSYPGKNSNETQWNSVANVRAGKKRNRKFLNVSMGLFMGCVIMISDI